jgi:GDP-L-fucose synthase
LITGGDGFLAKSLHEKLDGHFDIIRCNRAELDLNDAELVAIFLKHHQFDVVIHAATYDAAPMHSTKDKSKVLESNLRMFFNLARCSNEFGKMIYFGSGAEFSRPYWYPNMDEAFFDIHVPTDQYGYSKYLMTKYALTSEKIINLRLFGVFGEYDDWRYRFIANAFGHVVKGLPINVENNARVDYLFVDDLASIVSWFMTNKPRHQVYNVCSGQAHEHVAIANMIAELTNQKSEVVVKNRNIVKNYSGTNNLLLSEIGQFNFTPIRQSLDILYGWYQLNNHTIDAEQFHF